MPPYRDGQCCSRSPPPPSPRPSRSSGWCRPAINSCSETSHLSYPLQKFFVALGLRECCIRSTHTTLAFSTVLSFFQPRVYQARPSSGLQDTQWCGVSLHNNLFRVRPTPLNIMYAPSRTQTCDCTIGPSRAIPSLLIGVVLSPRTTYGRWLPTPAIRACQHPRAQCGRICGRQAMYIPMSQCIDVFGLS